MFDGVNNSNKAIEKNWLDGNDASGDKESVIVIQEFGSLRQPRHYC